MTIGDIAALIAAIAAVAFVAFIAVPLIKLGGVLSELRLSVREVSHHTLPILTELRSTVANTNTELEKVAVLTQDAATVTTHATVVSENAAQLATLFSATLGGPLVKVAAFSYGMRRTLTGRRAAAPRRKGA
ncbi:DUF948 domain-containing protein [Parenemella sanctibonifatiensis]|uniref:DUF948 domain-containing protein n=1 Tax=Parenemella sanctibonifatiensis TaxID=2016505 RepID=A0A255E5G4_9ACTN|nr:DUF948 domain-containing protein [Parenemella sanctibonifatiensis]OYN86530.1 DUF948 domain-containing protein [Parenemella sanctibonifatiensis]OYN91034.1 DUF948 domain-containing protein [Parenemella sanctibonifatiensis]